MTSRNSQFSWASWEWKLNSVRSNNYPRILSSFLGPFLQDVLRGSSPNSEPRGSQIHTYIEHLVGGRTTGVNRLKVGTDFMRISNQLLSDVSKFNLYSNSPNKDIITSWNLHFWRTLNGRIFFNFTPIFVHINLQWLVSVLMQTVPPASLSDDWLVAWLIHLGRSQCLIY